MNVEKTLVKTAIYTFITSFLLLIVLIPRTRVTQDASGAWSSEGYTYPDFFFMILKYSIVLAFVSIIIVILIKLLKKHKR